MNSFPNDADILQSNPTKSEMDKVRKHIGKSIFTIPKHSSLVNYLVFFKNLLTLIMSILFRYGTL